MLKTLARLPAIVAALLLSGCALTEMAGYQVVLDDLNEPRGLLWRADGTLCVAETGHPSVSREDIPRGIDNSAATGALTCLDPDGAPQRLVEGLPYLLNGSDGTSVGATDVAELDGQLYLLMAEGRGSLSRTILDVTDARTPPQVVADFLAFVADPLTLDYNKATFVKLNPFAMIADVDRRRFLVTDGATGEVFSASVNGAISIFSQVEGHDVLTGIAWGPDRLAYVASFSRLPHTEGSGSIVRLQMDGRSKTILKGLTAPIDLAFDSDGRLYVLEFMSGADGEHPYRGKLGRLLRFRPQGDGWGEPKVLITGLPYPIGIVIAPDDNLYLSIHGAYSEAGTGRVLRFDDLAQRELNMPSLQYREP